MIELCGVTQHYGVRPVLTDVDLRIAPACLTAIVGPNGIGKSTLLSVMAGVLSPQEGSVHVDRLRRRGSQEEELAIRRQTVYLPDHPWLPKERTGREYLLAVGRLYEIGSRRLLEHVEKLLAVFELARQGDWPIRSYSNGQKKKIAVCAALVSEARLLLLDEPFAGGLDPAGISALKRIFARLTREQSRTVVLTAPVPELVEEIADRIVVLRDGRVVAHDTLPGLRRLTRCEGSLAEVLALLTHPQTASSVDQYFKVLAS